MTDLPERCGQCRGEHQSPSIKSCSEHQRDDEKLYYLQWHHRADESNRRGEHQRWCAGCGRWFFSWEMAGERSPAGERDAFVRGDTKELADLTMLASPRNVREGRGDVWRRVRGVVAALRRGK